MKKHERAKLAVWIASQLFLTLFQGLLVALVVKAMLASFNEDAPVASVAAVCVVAVGALRLQRLALPRRRRRRRNLSLLESQADRDAAAEGSAARFLGPTGAAGRAQPAIVWDAPLPETLEHRFARMYRHVDRVTYAVAETRHYDSGVRPVLLDLARDRLRRYHGVDLAAEPARSRALMGDDLWTAITATPPRTPTVADLDRWLKELEAMSVDQPARS